MKTLRVLYLIGCISLLITSIFRIIDLIYGKKVKDALFEPQLIKRETTLGIK